MGLMFRGELRSLYKILEYDTKLIPTKIIEGRGARVGLYGPPLIYMSRDSAVGIATGYGLDN
jgi:hypothetical protein